MADGLADPTDATTLTLAPERASVGIARRHLRDALATRGVPADVVDDAVLATSELVTNAVLHARTPLTVLVDANHHSVRVGVRDGDDTPIDLPELVVSARGMTGRG